MTTPDRAVVDEALVPRELEEVVDERELEEHERLLSTAQHLHLAEIELRNALRAALDDDEHPWTLERIAMHLKQVNEVHSIVSIPRDESCLECADGSTLRTARMVER